MRGFKILRVLRTSLMDCPLDSIGMQKNSEFAELFDYNIIKMQESGILGRIGRQWTEKADNDYGVAEPAPLAIENVMFLGRNSIDILNFGLKNASSSGTTAVLEHCKFRHVSKLLLT